MNFNKTYLALQADIGILLLLMMTGLFQSLFLGLLDIGAVSFFLRENTVASVLPVFLGMAFINILIAPVKWQLMKKEGYGCAPVVTVLALLLFSLLIGVLYYPKLISNFILLFAYICFFILGASFWGICKRFIEKTETAKVICIICAQLFGFWLAGMLGVLIKIPSVFCIYMAFGVLLITLLCYRLLVYYRSINKETFFYKTGGIPDKSRHLLLYGIFASAFGLAVMHIFILYNFYLFLAAKQTVLLLSWFWVAFGVLGVLGVFLSGKIRYAYPSLIGIFLLIAGAFIAGMGGKLNMGGLIIIGTLLFQLMRYFYVTPFIKTLQRPMPFGNRTRIGKIRLKWIEPCGFIVGTILLTLTMPVFQQLIILDFILIFVMGLTICFYNAVLLSSFKMRLWRSSPLLLLPGAVFRYIKAQLRNGSNQDKQYFLTVLEENGDRNYEQYLYRALKNYNNELRVYILTKIIQKELYFNHYNELYRVFQKESSSHIRQLALTALILQTPEAEVDKKYSQYLTDKKFKEGAIIGFLKKGEDNALRAMEELQRLVFSDVVADNIMAAKILCNVQYVGLYHLAEHLLKLPNIEVQEKALLAAGKIKHPLLLSHIIHSLSDVRLRETALTALKGYGKNAYPVIEHLLNDSKTNAGLQKTLILFLSQLPGGESKQILLRAIRFQNQNLRYTLLQVLSDSTLIWSHKQKNKILKDSILKDIHRIRVLSRFKGFFSSTSVPAAEESFLYIRKNMQWDIETTRAIILYQLGLLKTHPFFKKAIRLLLKEDEKHYAVSAAVIQDFLPASFYKKIKPILLKEYPIFLNGNNADTAGKIQVLKRLLLHSPQPFSPWTKVLFLYALCKLNATDSVAAVYEVLKNSTDFGVVETGIWTLSRLEKDLQRVLDQVSHLPTSILTQQNLDNLIGE